MPPAEPSSSDREPRLYDKTPSERQGDHGGRGHAGRAEFRNPRPLCYSPNRLSQVRNPSPTVDTIIELPSGIVLIERRNPPPGWALPGGFVEYGETVEAAAV